MKHDLVQSLMDVMNDAYIQYRGCLLEKDGDRYNVFGKWHNSIFQAKDEVDKYWKNFNEQINKSLK